MFYFLKMVFFSSFYIYEFNLRMKMNAHNEESSKSPHIDHFCTNKVEDGVIQYD